MKSVFSLQRTSDVGTNFTNVGEIEFAVTLAWRSYTNERYFGTRYRRCRINSCRKESSIMARRNHLLDICFDDGATTFLDSPHFNEVWVDSDNTVAARGETRRGHRSNISEPKNADRLHS